MSQSRLFPCRQRYAILFLCACAIPLLGCPLLGPLDAPVEIVVTNSTAWQATLAISIDGQQTDVQVDPGASTTPTVETCPETVALISQTFSLSGSTVTTALDQDPTASLTRDSNFSCGDRIVIEVLPDATNVRTEASE